MLYFSLYIS